MKHDTRPKASRRVDVALALIVATLVATFGPRTAAGAKLAVASYDVTDTPLSRFGCWQHVYTGTIALTGRKVIGCGNDPPVPIANYANGSGTLNDGGIGTSYLDNHLFTITPFDGGPPFNPTITLHLASPSVVKSIRIHGGDDPNNATPGSIEGVTVEIGGVAVAFATTPSGGPSYYGVPVDDDIDLAGSVLAGIVTDRVVLRDFVVTPTIYGEALFSITEIDLDGDAALVFGGTPGKADCHGKSVSALARKFGGMTSAASELGFESVEDLHGAIRAFCRE